MAKVSVISAATRSGDHQSTVDDSHSRPRYTAGRLCEEDQGDDTHLHVLVYAGQPDRLDRHPGLLLDFTAEAILDGLAEFEHPPGQLPGAVVTASDDEDAALVVGDDGSDADGVAARLGHRRRCESLRSEPVR